MTTAFVLGGGGLLGALVIVPEGPACPRWPANNPGQRALGEPPSRLPERGLRRYPSASAGTKVAALGVPRPVTGSQPVVAG